MELIETTIKDCWLIRNTIFHDERGYFLESFNQRKFSDLSGWQGSFVQDNQSSSSKNVIRGLHYQEGAHAQAKLVRVLQGRVLDAAVDLRPDSPSFGKVFTAELADDNEYQLFVPRGCAHGFSVLSESAVFFYKCDNYYHRPAERSIFLFDDDLQINWRINRNDAILSLKDQQAPLWGAFLSGIV